MGTAQGRERDAAAGPSAAALGPAQSRNETAAPEERPKLKREDAPAKGTSRPLHWSCQSGRQRLVTKAEVTHAERRNKKLDRDQK